jgi:hypothetical protein
MQYEAKSGKTAKGAGDGLVIAFMANAETEGKLDSGKPVPKFKSGWKARDDDKAKAKAFFDKLKPAEQQEIRDYYKAQIDEFLAKKRDFREFAQAGAGRRGNLYR